MELRWAFSMEIAKEIHSGALRENRMENRSAALTVAAREAGLAAAKVAVKVTHLVALMAVLTGSDWAAQRASQMGYG